MPTIDVILFNLVRPALLGSQTIFVVTEESCIANLQFRFVAFV